MRYVFSKTFLEQHGGGDVRRSILDGQLRGAVRYEKTTAEEHAARCGTNDTFGGVGMAS